MSVLMVFAVANAAVADGVTVAVVAEAGCSLVGFCCCL